MSEQHETVPPEFGPREAGAVYQLRPGAHALIVDGERIALVRAPIGLMLPGGGLDEGEDAHAAVRRETLEECGLQVAVGDEIGVADELVFARSEQRHVRKRAQFFSCHVTGHGAASEPDHELVWMALPDAVSGLSYGSHRWALEQWLARR